MVGPATAKLRLSLTTKVAHTVQITAHIECQHLLPRPRPLQIIIQPRLLIIAAQNEIITANDDFF